MSSRTYNRGEIIFRQGDNAEEMFDVLSGSVGVYVGYGTPDETKLTVLKAGEFLGEMGLIEAYPRSATAGAEEDGTRLNAIDSKEFSEYFQSRPARLLLIMRQLSDRLRDRTEDYRAACKIRDEMLADQQGHGKGNKTLLERIKAVLEFYNQCLASGDTTMY